MTTHEVLEPHKPREDAKYGYCEDCGVPLSANLFTVLSKDSYTNW